MTIVDIGGSRDGLGRATARPFAPKCPLKKIKVIFFMCNIFLYILVRVEFFLDPH